MCALSLSLSLSFSPLLLCSFFFDDSFLSLLSPLLPLPYPYPTCCWGRSCRIHSMATTQANNANCKSPQKQIRSQNKDVWNRSRQRKDKIMTNSTNNISIHIGMNSEKLEEVISFKYLEPTMCKSGTCSAPGLYRQWQQWPE